MLSTPQPKHLRFALTVPSSTARLRFSAFRRAVSQHELILVSGNNTGTNFTQMMNNINEMEIL